MQALTHSRSEKPVAQRYLNLCQAYLRLNKAYAGLDLSHNELQSKFLHLFQYLQTTQTQLLSATQELEQLRRENQELRHTLTQTQSQATAYQAQAEKRIEHLQACYQGVNVLLEQFELLLQADSMAMLNEAEAAVAADQELLVEVDLPDNPLAVQVVAEYEEQLFFSTPQQRQQQMNERLAQLDIGIPTPAVAIPPITSEMIEPLSLAVLSS